MTPVWERVGGTVGGCLMTCEHASNQLPTGWTWPESDQWICGTHWAWDPGAAEVARGVATAIGATLVLSRFSRLLCDANRGPWERSWARPEAEGRAIGLNRGLGAPERARRHDLVWAPYHAAVETEAHRHAGLPVVSIHSFTPVYEGGPPRPMVFGVLFDRAEPVARRIALALQVSGLPVALNEPWSGRDGLMYAPERAARVTGGPCIEIEIRNDVAGDPVQRAAVVTAIASALAAVGWA